MGFSVRTHIDTPRSNVGAVLIDFLSSFNALSANVLADRLTMLQVPSLIVKCSVPFLKDRLQFVGGKHQSAQSILSTGKLAGLRLSPLLFSIYTGSI